MMSSILDAERVRQRTKLYFIQADHNGLPLSCLTDIAESDVTEVLKKFPEGVTAWVVTEKQRAETEIRLGNEPYPCNGCTLCCTQSWPVRLEGASDKDGCAGVLTVPSWDQGGEEVAKFGHIREGAPVELPVPVGIIDDPDEEFEMSGRTVTLNILTSDSRPDDWCVHCSGQGCEVYGQRPATCRVFRCASMVLLGQELPEPIRQKGEEMLARYGVGL